MLKYTIDSEYSSPPEVQGEVGYIHNLDINQIYHEGNNDGTTSYIIKINGDLFRNENSEGFTNAIDDANIYINDIAFVYAKKEINSSNGDIESITEFEEVINFLEADFLSNNQGNIPEFSGSRVGLKINPENISEFKKIIKMPKKIIQDLLDKEFGESSLVSLNALDANYELNFSIDKPQKTVDILQNIAQNTNFFYKTSISNSKPTVVSIKNAYSEADKTIFVDYIESYQFSKTKIEDLAIKCRVKYGYDYISESFKHVTEEIASQNIEDYKNFYGLTTEQVEGDDFLLEHEAPYIQDEPTALLLRNHLHELHKNQHTIVDFKLNLSQGFELEVGDIINFATIGDSDDTSFFSPYGVDIMTLSGLPYLQGIEAEQSVLPFFMIIDINKTMSNVSIKAIQLHALAEAVQVPSIPDDDDDQLVQTPGDVLIDGVPWQSQDYLLMLHGVLWPSSLNEQQLLNADLNLDGNLDLLDLQLFIDYYINNFMGGELNPGDLDGDGYITQNDVDLAQDYVDDSVLNPLTLEQIANADIDSDGIVTQDDVELITGRVKPIPGPVDPIGDLLMDTEVDNVFGAFSLKYENDKIVISMLAASLIDGEVSTQMYLEGLEENNQTLVGTVVTLQPTLSGDLESWPYYFWLGAAGDYEVDNVEFLSSASPVQYKITLDVGAIDGSSLMDIGAANGLGELNDLNVKIYGTPDTNE